MKRFKRNLAVLLAAIMVVSVMVPAFADEIDLVEEELTGESKEEYTEEFLEELGEDDIFELNVHSAAMGSDNEKDLFDDEVIVEAAEGEGLPEEEHVLRMDFDVNSFDYTQNETYLQMIMEAARVTKLNPLVITTMILQEQGKDGGTPMVTGAGTEDGKYVSIYNFINYEAYYGNGMGSLERGLWWANGGDTAATSYGRPWNSPERSIFRGFAIFSANYRGNGQENLYFKKFNTNPKSWDDGHWATRSDGSKVKFAMNHQYMTNVAGASNEAKILRAAYDDMGITEENLVFYIPVYSGMPDEKCPKPKDDGSLKTPDPYDEMFVNAAEEDFDNESEIEEQNTGASLLEIIEEKIKEIFEENEAALKIWRDFKNYDGYALPLLKLYSDHPNWTFVKKEIPGTYKGVETKWGAIIEGETQPGCNVISGSKGPEWKKDKTATGSWVEASKKAVEYYMDPRNFLNEEGIFQFLHMGYDATDPEYEYLNEDVVSALIEGTFLEDDVIRTYPEEPEPEEPDNPQPEPERRTYSSGSTNTIPKGAVTGTWTLTPAGKWTFVSKDGKTYNNEWSYNYNPFARGSQQKASWFFFDAAGNMLTGYQWLPSLAGGYRLFYFHEAADGMQGRMYENEKTPDGNMTDANGWVSIGGVTQSR